MKNKLIPYLLALAIFIIPACLGTPAPTETPTPTIEETEVAPTEEIISQTGITVCMGQEPNTLYPFGELNPAARSVLAAVFDGPIDHSSYEYQPVILTQLPSLDNGDAQIVTVKVDDGDQLVDADGNLTQLKVGMSVRPAGFGLPGSSVPIMVAHAASIRAR